MNCDCISVSEAIWSSARGDVELTREELEHARTCGSCARMLEEAQAAVAALDCVKPYPEVPDCRQSVMSRIDRSRRAAAPRRLGWALVLVGATVLALAIYFGIPGQPSHTAHVPPKHESPALVAPPVATNSDAAPTVPEAAIVRGPDKAPAKPVDAGKTSNGSKPAPMIPQPREDSPDGSGTAIVKSLGSRTEFQPGSAGCSPQPGLSAADAIPSAEQITFRQMLQSQIERAAMLMAGESGGRSTLLLGSGVSADPARRAFRLGKWGGLPLATLYPVSRPVDTHISGFGFGRILGALAVLGYDEPSVYVVFAPVTGGSAHPESVVLLLPGVDDAGTTTYAKLAEAALTQRAVVAGKSLPRVSLSCGDSRISVEMDWPKESYGFDLAPDLVLP